MRFGSITISRAPRFFACLIAAHCTGSAADGLRPTSSIVRACAISSPDVMFSPVARALTARQPPHRSWLIIQLGLPIDRMVRARITPRLKNEPLTAPAIASGP
jgi:hypothetical protein